MNPAPRIFPRFVRAALVAVFAALPAAGLLAQNSTFTASKGNQQWGTAANWTGSGVPNSAGAIANLAANGGVSNLAIGNYGLGYTLTAPSVSFTAGTGAGGTVATATMSNRVAIIQVTNAGSGYTTAPTVTFSGGNGTVSAVGTASINAVTGKVTGVSIGFPGYGFTSAPTVTLTGGGGTDATAVASIAPGVVGFNITTAGVYTVVPTVAIVAPTGTFTTANGTVTLTGDAVSAVTIVGAGTGYVVPPTVTFSAAPTGGTTATGYAVLSGATVGSVAITHAGSGYTTAPTVTLSAPNATATATAALAPVPYLDNVGGTYPYTVGTLNVTYAANVNASMGRADTSADILNFAQVAGVQATATATVTGEAVTAAAVDVGGSGYDLPPVVIVTGGGGRGAVLTPVLASGVLTGLTVTNGGSGYTSTPTITIQSPDSPAVNVTVGSNQQFFYGTIAGSQGLTKAGNGTLTTRFNNDANTFTGPIYITGGAFGIQTDSSLGDVNNSVTISGGAKLLVQPSTNAAVAIPATRAITLAGAGAQIGNASPYSGPLSIPSNITGPGGLTKTEAGNLILSGTNTYLGETIATGGLLVVATPSALPGYRDPQDSLGVLPPRIKGTSTGALVVRMGGAGEWTASDFDDLINNAGSFTAGNTIGIDTTNATGTVTIDGLLSPFVSNPTYGFAKSGPGTLEINESNGYTGPTTIFEGTLKLTGGDNRLPAATNLTFPAAGATLDLGGNTQTVATITEFTGGGNSTITNGNLIVNGGALTFGGATGTLVDLSGLSSFTYTPTGTELKVEPSNATNATTNTVLLAKSGASGGNNTLSTSGRVMVGGGPSSSNDKHVATMQLGTINSINTALFQMGGFNAAGTVNFQSGLTAPSLKLRAFDGIGRGNVTVGETSSGLRSGEGVLDLTGGSLDALVNVLMINRHLAANVGVARASSLTIAGGTLDATTIILNDNPANGPNTPVLTASLNQSGGIVKVSTLNFGQNSGNATTLPDLRSSYNLSGGTLNAATMLAGAGGVRTTSVRRIGWTGGTLANYDAGTDLVINGADATNSGVISLALSTNATKSLDVGTGRSATLGANTTLTAATTDVVLTKTGNGTLTLSGNSTAFIGTLQLSAGRLELGAGTTIRSAAIGTGGNGSLTWNSGTIGVDLSTVDSTSDALALGGVLNKGSGSSRVFDFKNAGTTGGNYTLATYTSTDLVASDLSAVNVPGGTATFTVGATSLTAFLGSAGDTTAPDAPTVSLLAASDTGSSSSDLITKLTTPTIAVVLNGTGPTAPLAGDVVKLFNGATQIASATLVAGDISTGSVNLTSSTLAEGSLSFTATVTDAANNVSTASNTLTVTLDTTAPVIAAAAPVSSDWGSSYSDVTPIATDAVPTNPVVITTGSVNIAKPGAYVLSYNAQDTAGNNAVQVQRTVTVAIANATVVGADGLTPLMRYALGANGPSDTVQAPVVSSTSTTLSLTAVVRTDDPKLTVLGTTKTDLASGSWTTTGVSGSPAGSGTGTPLSAGRETKVYTVTTGSKTFLRLEATLAP